MRPIKIALIGFRATGKSLLGEILAKKLDWRFIDMDEQLVSHFGMDIKNWVERFGWDSFRKEESFLLKELASSEKLVVATGGGIVLDSANRKLLRDSFMTVWLKASAEAIFERISQDPKSDAQRPALTDLSLKAEIDRLLEERYPLYEESSSLSLHTEDASPDELAFEIELLLREHP